MLDRLWAECLTVIAASLLVPLEIYELVRQPTLVRAGRIVVKIAIVVYRVDAAPRRARRLAT